MKDKKRYLLILKLLAKTARPTHAYSIFSQIRISPGQLLATLNYLEEKGLATLHADDRYNITEHGKRHLLENRFSLTGKPDFKSCPPEFKATKIGVNEPYAPKLAGLDNTSFQRIDKLLPKSKILRINQFKVEVSDG